MRLTSDLTAAAEAPQLILTGKACGFAEELTYEPTGAKGYVAEGPFVYRQPNGGLVLFWSTIGKNGYCVAANVSRHGMKGTFEPHSVLFDGDGGHCMVFCTYDGTLKMTFHRPNRTPDERAQIIDLTEDGLRFVDKACR